MDSKKLIAAVFDVDRTLVPGTTTERTFIRYLLRKRVIGLGSLARTALYLLRSLPRMSPMAAIREQREYLAGQPVERILPLARACFETDIKPVISKAGMEALRWHREQGHITVLLSGSLEFLLKPFQEYVGADHLIAAKMEVRNGRFTGRIEGVWPYGDRKAVLINHFAREHGVHFEASYAYADHHTDEAVLALFGNPVVINAAQKMRDIAGRRKWEMRDFR